MRVTIDLMKKSTQIIDLSDVINPRVGDDDLLLPLHIVYGDNQTDMRGKDVEFLSNDTNGNRIYVAGTCNTNTPGDNLYMGNLTFRFPAGTFKADGTYDPDKTMFRIVDKATHKVISSVNVKITVMKNSLEFDFDPDNTSYDSRLEEMLHGFHDKGQAMLDEIKDLNNQAKSNVSGDTAATAKEAKQQANDNSGKVHDLQGEVGDARGRFMTLSDREDNQDFNIERKEDKSNANANYAAQNLRNDAQDKEIAKKANQSFITDYLSRMYLQPEGFANANDLKTKYPNGKPGIMVTADTGHKWIWVNGTWQDCGVYQAAADLATLKNRFINKADDLKIPYDDLDTLPVNSVVTYVPGLNVSNCPTAITGNYTVHTIGASADASNAVGAIQMLFSEDNSSYYYRSAWGYPDTKWSSWQACADSEVFTNKADLVSPYNNLDLLPSGSIVTYASGILTNDFPFAAQGFTVITNGKGFPEAGQKGIAAGKVQFAITNSPTNFYYRIAWGTIPKWTKWHSLNNSYVFTGKDGLIDQYKDLDTLPAGSTVTYAAGVLEHDFPYVKNSLGFTIVTNGNGFSDDDVIKAGQIQRVTCTDGSEYHRIAWGVPAKWSAWQIDSYESQMQDINLPSLAIFKKFGVVGDSFSKGYMRKPDGTVLNETDNKWGAFMAKQYGTQFTDLSVSGQTTRSCVDNTLATLKTSGPLDAYFIILGINDAASYNKIELGSIDDIKASANDNPRTFFGDYGRIISAALTTSPNARIVLFTIMADWGEREQYDAAIKEIGKHYELPVIDVLNDPYFSSDEYTSLQSGGHPTVPGYGILAKHLMRLIQKCVVDNPDYFNFMGC